MQSKATLKRIGGFLQKSLMVLGLFCFFAGKINAQTYVNGNLSTGPTASSGEAAPAGFNWSEVQVGNNNAGYSASIDLGFSLADDFTISAGTWGVTKFTCYAYSTGYAGATSPFTDMRVQIFDTDPSVGGVTPIYGDLTTNVLSSSSSAGLYRIFNATAGTTRLVWKLEANISVSLTAGTYWVEWQTGTALASNFSPASTVVGTVTQPGNNALQHTLAGDTWAPVLDGPTAADPQDMPFIIDYTTTACTGTPAPGATLSSSPSVCPGSPFTLSVETPTAGSGVVYQWQSSPDGMTFTDIPGATNPTFTTSLTVATYYQVSVSCGGGTPVTSTPIQILLNAANLCGCVPPASDCTDGDIITNVTLSTLNNTSDCGTGGFTDYTLDPTVIVPDLVQGIANPISVDAGGGLYPESVAVWIDYDHSGSFDASEITQIGGTTGGTLTANINVPTTAMTGLTKMRVRVQFNADFAGGDACAASNLDFGETEDYNVNIIPCVQGTFDTQPANVSAECGGVATLTVAATGTFLTYQWQQQAGPGAPWVDLVDGPDVSGATTNTVTISNVTTALDGYNYRVLISGGCTAVDFSDVVSLTVTPKVIDVSPVSYSTCTPIPAGAPIQLSITTAAGGSVSTTTSYPSGPINLLVPDAADGVGVTTSVTVPPLPAGAVITAASVTLNATHTYVGDLIIALQAPNNEVFNLDYALNSTGGPGATTGFTNTVISSTGTQTLDVGTDPFTDIFAPDAVVTIIPGNPPAAPSALIATGVPTVNTFAGLYSVPDGVWTLGLFDYATPDEGTLDDWTLTLTYSVTSSAPLGGVWTPATGLFLDAAGTIPYAGTVENTVYAAPTVSTDYTVTVNTGACPSDPVVIPVTIGTPVGTITQQPADVIACEGETVTFTSDVTAGASVTYQWQVSTDNGTIFTDIPGATGSTLTLSGIAAADDASQYRLVVTATACADFVISNAATLTVNALPDVTITASSNTPIYPGTRTVLTATLNPPATPQTTYQWYYNGQPVPGATSSTFEVNFGTSGNGAFSVRVSNPSLCSGFVSADFTVSDSATTSLYIWPNPSTGQFQVRFNDGITDILSGTPYLTVFDGKGSRVFTQSYSLTGPYGRMDVDLRNQPKGTYVVVLYTSGGDFVRSGRVIIR